MSLENRPANRLIGEASPYLLQHAYNPVDWYPWGEEAFARARELDRPVFLSIGYATCHWCHVMEHESFEDDAVAALMNQTFVNIKLDREERPDIDQVYMAVCQLLTGHGGWPLTVFLTPEKKPFHVATYIPKHSRHGRAGMLDLIPQIAQVWQTQRSKIEESGTEILGLLLRDQKAQADSRSHQPAARERSEASLLSSEDQTDAFAAQASALFQKAYDDLSARFDPARGGFSQAPKFPTPHNLSFLLRYHLLKPESRALEMVQTTLTSMRAGGIFDHVGGGFHRYSTDPEWLLPHFEKMLYDNALLAQAYLEAYQVTGDELYKETVKAIFTYVERDLLHPEGGLYCAEDADSEGEEGKFYIWTQDELQSILGGDSGPFCEIFQVAYDGNFRDEATHALTGQNILHLDGGVFKPERLTEIDWAFLQKSLDRLLEVRSRRIRPLLDDKILTDWNALMISAYAKAGSVLDNEDYLKRAREGLLFIAKYLRLPDGRLLHRFRQGQAGIPGFLDDYVFLTQALLDFFEARGEVWALREALSLGLWTQRLFADLGGDRGLFFTSSDGEKLPVRKKEFYDGAMPSGHSVAALNFLRLFHLTGDAAWEGRSEDIIQAQWPEVERYPSAYTQFLQALYFKHSQPAEIVIAAGPHKESGRQLQRQLQRPFFPGKVLLYQEEGQNFNIPNGVALSARRTKTPDATEAGQSWAEVSALVEGKVAATDAPLLYLCRNFTCQAPVRSAEEIANRIELVPLRPIKKLRGFLKGIDTSVERESDR